MRTVYIQGEYLPENQAKVSLFDRGYLFADAVYEVTAVLNGKMIDNEGHLIRLQRSLRELEIPLPLSIEEIEGIQKKLIELNGLKEGSVYLQISRGVEDRNFLWSEDLQPVLTLFTQEHCFIDNPKAESGLNIKTVPDIRWQRRDIKTVQLLAQSLALLAGKRAGCDDVWMISDHGFISEGSSNNAFIVKDKKLITHPADHHILNGITRQAIMRLCRENDLQIDERPFSLAEALAADEAFITSSTKLALPVVSIDGQTIGDGRPGEISRKLRALYIEIAKEQTA